MRQASLDRYRLNLVRPKNERGWSIVVCFLIGGLAFAAGAFDIGVRLFNSMGY